MSCFHWGLCLWPWPWRFQVSRSNVNASQSGHTAFSGFLLWLSFNGIMLWSWIWCSSRQICYLYGDHKFRVYGENLWVIYVSLLVAVTWKNQEAKLTLHYDNGFILRGVQPSDPHEKPQVLWSYPYEKLRMSSDDGHRLLWLEFAGDGEQVILIHYVCNTHFHWPRHWKFATLKSKCLCHEITDNITSLATKCSNVRKMYWKCVLAVWIRMVIRLISRHKLYHFTFESSTQRWQK